MEAHWWRSPKFGSNGWRRAEFTPENNGEMEILLALVCCDGGIMMESAE